MIKYFFGDNFKTCNICRNKDYVYVYQIAASKKLTICKKCRTLSRQEIEYIFENLSIIKGIVNKVEKNNKIL